MRSEARTAFAVFGGAAMLVLTVGCGGGGSIPGGPTGSGGPDGGGGTIPGVGGGGGGPGGGGGCIGNICGSTP
jgi:hypothetical protein